jgi:hypothetical protein
MTDGHQLNRDRAALIREFYSALSEKHAAAIGRLVEQSFSSEVTLVLPDSLPYGGTVTGADRLGRMFVRMASMPVDIGPVRPVVTDIVNGGERLAVQLEFDWYAPGVPDPLRSSALELWTFDGAGLVREIRAYYWDTAACAALTQNTHS